jgi:DNA helicase II / ATP-dependent DNA helicase PcrA
MKLNDQQKDAVAFDGSICIAACPGSGKTRTIVAKVIRCIEDVRDTARRIACITYTHAAVYEIETRLREHGSTNDEDYCEIGTIHSFCLSNILQPFHYMLPELKTGFKVIAPESEEWQILVLDLAEKYALNTRRLEAFTVVHRNPDHSLFVPRELPDDAASDLVRYLDEHSLVSFNDIVYHSCRLVEKFGFIASGMASRFAWMLIDEFQDTSDGQVAVLSAIAHHGRTKFFLVGDLNQSIMGFAGAYPNLMRSFSLGIAARMDIGLIGNYRCSQKIVDHAERLIATNPRMRAVGPWRDYLIDPEYIHVKDLVTGICDHFLPALKQSGIPLGKASVLAPWWLPLYYLARNLRDRGVAVIGPGARPYHRTRLFAAFAENLCAYIEDGSPDLFRSSLRALFLTLLNITGGPEWRVFSYDGRRCMCQLATLAKEISQECSGQALTWLKKTAIGISSSLMEDDFLPPAYAKVLFESAEDMVSDIQKNHSDAESLCISDLGLFAKPHDCLHLLTMHGAKGREYDAVAIVDLHKGRLPHFSCATEEEYDEARRQLYVALTRARKLLFYLTDSSDRRNQPSPFLVEMGLVDGD